MTSYNKIEAAIFPQTHYKSICIHIFWSSKIMICSGFGLKKFPIMRYRASIGVTSFYIIDELLL